MEGDKQEQFSLPKLEERILEFWDKNKIFEQSLKRREGAETFVFYEGPPTANGTPGVHHVEARTFKDIILRYKTMRGYFVPRRAGWDTHGLPVEIQVEKELGLKSKKEIEAYGVAAFNKKCKESVWKYRALWEELTRRMGFWLDFGSAYVTYTNDYIESLWWVIKQFSDKGYLYEDYKVVPWCSRCGTALSSHEIAQGYEEIAEESVYVKFKLKSGQKIGESFVTDENTFMLAWTTTPWTLPGNTALAVGENMSYTAVRQVGATFLLAKDRAAKLFPDAIDEAAQKLQGKDMVGVEYEPLYKIEGFEKKENDYTVIAGDFVSTADGTGIVHIAPAFGEDDFQVGKKNNLSVLMTTNERGLMETPGYTWDGLIFKTRDKKDKTANALIQKDLAASGTLLKTEIYKHDYPFCWRCKTPLMYFARKAWWVAVNKVRPALIANNEMINWYPDYLKHGRFGGWLKEEKDWAFSRERYWGTPLPVWRCDPLVGGCGAWEVMGSIAELAQRGTHSNNRYIIMRHGEAESNVKNIINSSLATNHYPLTELGKKQVNDSIAKLKKNNITLDVIVTSPFLRTKETADLLADAFRIEKSNTIVDARVGEVNTGIFDGKKPDEYHAFFANVDEKFTKAPSGGETVRDMVGRVWDVVSEMEKNQLNKTILIVTHEYPCWALWTMATAKTNEEAIAEKTKRGDEFLPTAGFEEVNFVSLPRDEKGNLDLHKPYIDQIRLSCAKCGGVMTRVPEVVDVWFDSGAMPYAEDHFPFAQKGGADFSKLNYPADYIVEAVDQTRGWFYNLLSVATLLGQSAPYRNVISLGHLLDEKGKKMSKSLGNIVDPMALMNQYGADPVRWYFFTINQPWDSKLFSEKDVQDASRRFFMILWNSFVFWKTYGNGNPPSFDIKKCKLVINQWIAARLNQLASEVTSKLDTYDIVGAARDIETFVVEDLSRWYIRRVRSIMRHESKESQETSATLHYVLLEISKLLAPFAPFFAEELYRNIDGKEKSVHFENFPTMDINTNQKLLDAMIEARRVVSIALEARARAGIKVRQPLAVLKVKGTKFDIAGIEELIQEEVNIKKVEYDANLKEDIWIDVEITAELKEEGLLRDLVREIQSARKEAGLQPKDSVAVTIECPEELVTVIKKNSTALAHDVNAKSVEAKNGEKLKISFD